MSETGDTAPGRRIGKPASAFRTIGEVADELDLPAHVLRFWEAKFPQLRPMKRGGGRRYYRPEDIVLLRRIRQFLYQEGYTIRGVQKLLNGAKEARPGSPEPAPTLFPLDPKPNSTGADEEIPEFDRPAPRSAARRLGPEIRGALGEIRRELLDAQSLLERLQKRNPSG